MIAPLYGNIAIRRIDETKTPGGLVLPEASRGAPGLARGTVVAVGAGRITQSGALAPLAVKVGDEVLLNASGATPWDDPDAGRLLIVQEGAIVGVLVPGPS